MSFHSIAMSYRKPIEVPQCYGGATGVGSRGIVRRIGSAGVSPALNDSSRFDDDMGGFASEGIGR